MGDLLKAAIPLLPLAWLAVPACGQGPPGGRSGGGAAEAARAPVAFYGVGERPRSTAVADLNGDLHPDVVVANSGDGTLTLRFGDGTGRLGEPVSIPAGREPSNVNALDLDGDGDRDLVVVNHETPLVTVLANDGRGRFAPYPGSPFDTGARPHVHGLATGDFDGDGWPDVAVESADTREVRVLRGGERGLSPAIAVPVGTMPYSHLGVGRPAGGSRLDILVPGHGDHTVRAVEHRDGAFREAAWRIGLEAQPWMVVGGDLDGDRRDDVAAVVTDAVSVWLAGDGGFARAPGSPYSIRGATEVAIGDLDGDGVADLAASPWNGDEVTLLVARATAVRKVRMCERPLGLAIADLDGDGRAELLATCATRNQLAIATPIPR